MYRKQKHNMYVAQMHKHVRNCFQMTSPLELRAEMTYKQVKWHFPLKGVSINIFLMKKKIKIFSL